MNQVVSTSSFNFCKYLVSTVFRGNSYST